MMLTRNPQGDLCLMTNSTVKIQKIIKIFIIVVFWLVVWQIISMINGSSFLLPSPIDVAIRLSQMCSTREFYLACGKSLLRTGAGCLLGIIFGTILGIITASSKTLYALFAPLLSVVKATPVASFIILLLLWLTRSGVTITVSMLLVVPIMWSNISSAISGVDAKLIEMARIFCYPAGKKIRHIYIPSVAPSFIAGVTTAIGFSWKAGISAEVIAVPKDAVGTALYYAKSSLEYTDVFAWTTALIIMSFFVEKVIVMAIKSITGEKYGNNS